MDLSLNQLLGMVDPSDPVLSIRQQCDLLGLARSTFYYKAAEESPENLSYMKLIDKQYLNYPWGVEKMTHWLNNRIEAKEVEPPLGEAKVNVKRVRRLMHIMRLVGVGPKPNTSKKSPHHPVYGYLLRDFRPALPNQVWSTDITYVPLNTGYIYLVAIIDWFDRRIVSWQLSNTMDVDFCLSALERGMKTEQPRIFNSDQGSQFTSKLFTDCLKQASCAISMDGVGRATDNTFIERFWWTIKYQDIYLRNYETVAEATAGIARFVSHYNNMRPHTSLKGHTPIMVYRNPDLISLNKFNSKHIELDQPWVKNKYDDRIVIGVAKKPSKKKKKSFA